MSLVKKVIRVLKGKPSSILLDKGTQRLSPTSYNVGCTEKEILEAVCRREEFRL